MYMYIYIYVYIYIYIHMLCIYMSSLEKWLEKGHRYARPFSSHFSESLLATSYNNLVSIFLSSLFSYILSVFEISFLGMGLRPSTYSAPFL